MNYRETASKFDEKSTNIDDLKKTQKFYIQRKRRTIAKQ